MKRSTVAYTLLTGLNLALSSVLILLILGIIPLPVQYPRVQNIANSLPSQQTAPNPLNRYDDEAAISRSGNGTPFTNQKRTVSSSEQENIKIYNRINEGVVNVTTEVISYHWFLEPIPRRGTTGSGSIIDEVGHVLTNYHVVQDAASVFVTLADGERYAAEVIASMRRMISR